MPHHEEKFCPRCQTQFECKSGSINLCQCATVSLSHEEREYIRKKFDDCLCAACLLALKKELKQKQFEEKVNQVFRFFNLRFPSNS